MTTTGLIVMVLVCIVGYYAGHNDGYRAAQLDELDIRARVQHLINTEGSDHDSHN